jgi:hypothetical protein
MPASEVGSNAGIRVKMQYTATGGKQSKADHCSSEQNLIQRRHYNVGICEISYIPTHVTPTTQYQGRKEQIPTTGESAQM